MALFFFDHVILTVVSCSMMSHAMLSRTFKVKVNSTGSKLCTVNTPSAVITMAANTMAGQCGVKCNVNPSCQLFQFKEDSAQCELFDYSPSNFSPIDHCTAYSAPPGKLIQSGTLVSSLSGTNAVRATALLNGQLFVVRWGIAQVSVYDTTSLQLLRQITFTGLSAWLNGIATSTLNNSLFISDNGNSRLHRVDLSANISIMSVVSWSVPCGPQGLSVTSDGNVLVTVFTGNINTCNKLMLYTPNGTLVRAINVTLQALWYVIELNNDIWTFTISGPGPHGICTTLTNGTLIKCLNGAMVTSGGVTYTFQPRQIVLGPRGYILIPDSGNNRILTVNPSSLSEARQLLLLPLNTGMTTPFALSFDESRGRLYVGEGGGQNRVLVFDGIW